MADEQCDRQIYFGGGVAQLIRAEIRQVQVRSLDEAVDALLEAAEFGCHPCARERVLRPCSFSFDVAQLGFDLGKFFYAVGHAFTPVCLFQGFYARGRDHARVIFMKPASGLRFDRHAARRSTATNMWPPGLLKRIG
jgi:hypothetical protein